MTSVYPIIHPLLTVLDNVALVPIIENRYKLLGIEVTVIPTLMRTCTHTTRTILSYIVFPSYYLVLCLSSGQQGTHVKGKTVVIPDDQAARIKSQLTNTKY